MVALATIEDLETRLGRTLEDPELGRAEALIEDASTLVRAETGRTWVDASDVPDARLVPIICAMVSRALKNAGGYSQQTVGSWSGTLAGDPENIASGLYLTNPERRILSMMTGRNSLRSVEIVRPEGFGPDNTVYVPTSLGGDYLAFLTEEWV